MKSILLVVMFVLIILFYGMMYQLTIQSEKFGGFYSLLEKELSKYDQPPPGVVSSVRKRSGCTPELNQTIDSTITFLTEREGTDRCTILQSRWNDE